MKLKKLGIICTMLLLITVGCSPENKNNKPVINSNSRPTASPETISKIEPIPGWLVEVMKSKFQQPEFKEDEISFFQVRMKRSNEPQIAAYLTMDRVNGVFVIFEKQGDQYKEVYEKREPVYGFSIFGEPSNQVVVFISGQGGTGMQENRYHVIKFLPDGYKEIWNEIAESYNFGGPLPWNETLGSLNFNMDEIVYSEIKRIYNKVNFNEEKPDRVEAKVEFFKFDYRTGRFAEKDILTKALGAN